MVVQIGLKKKKKGKNGSRVEIVYFFKSKKDLES